MARDETGRCVCSNNLSGAFVQEDAPIASRRRCRRRPRRSRRSTSWSRTSRRSSMSRSPDRAAALVIALVLLAPAVARGQDPQVLDLELPVQDLVLEQASLDNSVATRSREEREESRSRRTCCSGSTRRRRARGERSHRGGRRAYRDRRAALRQGRRIHRLEGLGATTSALSRRRAAGGRGGAARAAGRRRRRSSSRAAHGEADPVAANTKKDGSDSPKGRARDRRVTISSPADNLCLSGAPPR